MTSPPADLRWWQHLLAAAFVPLVVMQVGVHLFQANEKELINAGTELLRLMWGCLACGSLLFIALRWGRKPGFVVWAFACAWIVFALVRELAFPLPLGLVDGTNRFPKVGWGHRIAEGVTIVVAWALILALRRSSVKLAGAAALVFGLSSIAAVIQDPVAFGIVAATDSCANRTEVAMQVPAQNQSLPDIYQILFDEYQTVEYLYVRQERGIAPFDDFIFFQDNISNYNHTWLSLPSLLTGSEYTPDVDIRAWHKSFNNTGLLKSLHDNGYRIRTFGHHSSWWDCPLAVQQRCSNEIAQEWLKGQTRNELLSLTAMRFLPCTLAYRVSPYKRKPKKEGEEVPHRGDYPFYCTIKYREMLRGIKYTTPGGNYTLVHMILPHGPFVLDQDGNHVGNRKGGRMDQVYFVDRLVGELTAELKRLGRYEQSMIVVHSDHGCYYEMDWTRQEMSKGALKLVRSPEWSDTAVIRDGARWPLPMVEARASTLLLIKPPFHQGYRVSDAPTQLLDLAPTILCTVGLQAAAASYPGLDVVAAPPGPNRARRTFVYGAKIGGTQEPYMQEVSVQNGRWERRSRIPFRGIPY